MPNNTKLKISPKKTYRVYVYGDCNKWHGNKDVSGCKTVEECVLNAIRYFSCPEKIRTVSVMDVQTMQSARYKITFDNSKNGFALSE